MEQRGRKEGEWIGNDEKTSSSWRNLEKPLSHNTHHQKFWGSTVVQKGDSPFQWKMPNFEPSIPKPVNIIMNVIMCIVTFKIWLTSVSIGASLWDCEHVKWNNFGTFCTFLSFRALPFMAFLFTPFPYLSFSFLSVPSFHRTLYSRTVLLHS